APLVAFLALAWLPAAAQEAPGTGFKHGIAMHGEPKHADGFAHFDFANPDAPQGGELVRGVVGAFDSLNPFIVKGSTAAGVSSHHFASLMYRTWDEPFTLYGYVAEAIEVPEDRSWVAFRLNPNATFHDGTPITVDDVIFTMETLREKGTPSRRRNYGRIDRVETPDERTVKFIFNDEADQETPLIIGLMPVISKAYYTANSIEDASLDIPLGAGPYQIDEVDAGRLITLKRVEDWWGDDLPVFAGQFNFNTHRHIYYRDSTVALEAFKAGEYNYRLEFDGDRWSSAYDFAAARDGRATLMETTHGRTGGMRALVFNSRRPYFADPMVRQALIHAFDFEWINKTLLSGVYTRNSSFFVNSQLAATGLPEGRELELLEPFRADVPGDVFETPLSLPETDGSGNNRAGLREAARLLKEAGWTVDGGVLRDGDGQAFEFEMLLSSASAEPVALAFADALKRLGIALSVRTVESAQYAERTDGFDFDMILHRWGASLSPGAEQDLYWGSTAAETNGTRNYAGVQDPVVDALVDTIEDAPNREDLEAAVRALDRVLLNGSYVIPLYTLSLDFIGYWGEFGFVEEPPLYGHIATVDAWWLNQ
ncbi:MAG: extracellular solute-binding protein, partial [Pseudomonadota bacterium]